MQPLSWLFACIIHRCKTGKNAAEMVWHVKLRSWLRWRGTTVRKFRVNQSSHLTVVLTGRSTWRTTAASCEGWRWSSDCPSRENCGFSTSGFYTEEIKTADAESQPRDAMGSTESYERNHPFLSLSGFHTLEYDHLITGSHRFEDRG